MADVKAGMNRARAEASEAAHDAAPWLTRLARLGYAAKGAVYAIVGILALRAALGPGGRTTDTQGALLEVDRGPLGNVVLGVLALGLLGYAAWRIVAAATDSEDKGDGGSGVLKRLGYFASGLAHAFLAFYAVRLLLDDPGAANGGGGDGSTQDWTARLLGTGWGKWAVGLAGLGAIGLGLFQLYIAVKAKFREKLDLASLSARARESVVRVGQAGIAARAVVVGLVGYFLVRAALEVQASEARGLSGVLQTLVGGPGGKWALAVVAAGLVSYGLYCLVEALYRRINRPA